jgi:DNA repair protein RecO (recombination protein O)
MNRRERVALQPAYLLQHRAYSNTSLLIELLSRDYGRVGLVAKGARAPTSKLHGLLQPFRPLLLSWSTGGELGTLSGAESAGPSVALAGDSLFCGYYLNELLLRLLPRHAAHPVLLAEYGSALSGLAASMDAASRERALRRFEKHLLQESGYALLLDREADSEEPITADRIYRYQLEKGPLPSETDTPGIEVHGHTLLGLANGELIDARALREAKRLMRAALSLYLGDRPLKSREFFRKAHGSAAAPLSQNSPL